MKGEGPAHQSWIRLCWLSGKIFMRTFQYGLRVPFSAWGTFTFFPPRSPFQVQQVKPHVRSIFHNGGDLHLWYNMSIAQMSDPFQCCCNELFTYNYLRRFIESPGYINVKSVDKENRFNLNLYCKVIINIVMYKYMHVLYKQVYLVCVWLPLS